MASRDAPAQRAALADEVLLPDELLEAPWPHPSREGLALRRRLEEGLGARAGRAGRGARHGLDGSAALGRRRGQTEIVPVTLMRT